MVGSSGLVSASLPVTAQPDLAEAHRFIGGLEICELFPVRYACLPKPTEGSLRMQGLSGQ